MLTGNPSDIAVDSGNGWLYTLDAVNNRVNRFDKDGNLLNSWGSSGAGDGEFLRPSHIALDLDDGWVYVVDAGNHRIQRFDVRGRFLNSWGGKGIGDGQFNNPGPIVFDPFNNWVYVVERGTTESSDSTPGVNTWKAGVERAAAMDCSDSLQV